MFDKNCLEGSACPPCSSAPISPVNDYEKLHPELLKSKKICSIDVLLLSILYVKLVIFSDFYIAYKWIFVLFFALFFTTVELFAKLLKQPSSKESWFWAGVMLALPTGSWLFENGIYLSPWSGLFTHLAAAQYALTRMGGAAEPQAGALLPLDLLRAWFVLPFSNFFKNIKVFFYGQKKNKIPMQSKSFWWIILGIVLALPICLWAFSTLVAADGMFAYSMEAITRWWACYGRFDWLFNMINPTVLLEYGFFWCWFYGLFYGSFYRKYNTNSINNEEIYTKAEKFCTLPKQTIMTIFVLLCGLYLVFFCTQLQYLTMGFVGQLPQEYTASEYAREGFFELVRIVTVNLLVLAASAKFSSTPLRQNKLLKACGTVLCVCNLLVAVIALSKLWLYIDRFGITSKRVLALYAVCVIFLWSVLAIITLFRPIKAIVLAVHISAVLFCVFAFIDWTAVEKQFVPKGTEITSYVQIDY